MLIIKHRKSFRNIIINMDSIQNKICQILIQVSHQIVIINEKIVESVCADPVDFYV